MALALAVPLRGAQEESIHERWTATRAGDSSASWMSADLEATLDWVRTPYTPHGPLRPLLEAVKARALSTGDRIVREGELELGSLDGVELVRETAAGEQRQRIEVIYLRDGAYLHSITFQCPVATCDEHREAFDLLLPELERP